MTGAITSTPDINGNPAITMGKGSFGHLNVTTGNNAFTAGRENSATGQMAVALGFKNTATGNFSVAMGRLANAANSGCFIWADGTNQPLSSTTLNQFVVRSAGGFWLGKTGTVANINGAVDTINTDTGAHLTNTGIWTNNSDVNQKTGFREIDPVEILERLVAMPITTWKYKIEPDGITHIGPMAQDFARSFGLGMTENSIGTVDADGVAMAAIQGLYKLIEQRDGVIASQEARIADLERQMGALLQSLQSEDDR